MGVKRDEDFVTEFIFVKLFNRSQAFRDMIQKKFNGKKISQKIEFTGSKNKKDAQLGCPDAVGKDGRLYIEIKTKMSTPLTSLEKNCGAQYITVNGEFKNVDKLTPNQKKGNRNQDSVEKWGYINFLKEDRDNKLLYIVCNKDYNLDDPCKGPQVRIMYWTEILAFLKKSNSEDELIKVLENCVEGLDSEDEPSILDITTKLCKISVFLAKEEIVEETGIYKEEFQYILNSPIIWFELFPDINISGTWLGISLETGDVYLCAEKDAYNLLSNQVTDIKFGKSEIENISNNGDSLYLKIFSLVDYDEEDFCKEEKVIKTFISFLNRIKLMLSKEN